MGFFPLSVRGEVFVQTLPPYGRRKPNITSNASDYLTRSVRRASGFVLGAICPTAANLTPNHILTIRMRSVSFLLMTKRSSCAHDHNAE
jgi:hypothetical protein